MPDLSGLWNWMGSGWGDALASWQHPIASIETDVSNMTAGYDSFGFGTGAGSPAVGSSAVASPSSGGSGSAWPFVIAGIVILLLVVVLVHEVEIF